MLRRYMQAAMKHATYVQGAGDSYHGEIVELPGLHAEATTRAQCGVELQSNLAMWLQMRQCQGVPIPAMDGVPLVAWVWTNRGI